VLVYNQAIEFVDVKVQLVLTLNLVMLLREDFLGDLGLAQLMHGREHQYHAYEDDHRLPLVAHILQGLKQKDV